MVSVHVLCFVHISPLCVPSSHLADRGPHQKRSVSCKSRSKCVCPARPSTRRPHLQPANPVSSTIPSTSIATTHLRNQNPVTGRDAHRYPLAILVESTGTDSQNLGLVELLHCGLGEEDSAGGLGVSLEALHEDAVEEGSEVLDGAEGGLGMKKMD